AMPPLRPGVPGPESSQSSSGPPVPRAAWPGPQTCQARASCDPPHVLDRLDPPDDVGMRHAFAQLLQYTRDVFGRQDQPGHAPFDAAAHVLAHAGAVEALAVPGDSQGSEAGQPRTQFQQRFQQGLAEVVRDEQGQPLQGLVHHPLLPWSGAPKRRNKVGSSSKVSAVHVTRPLITTIASGRCTSEPGPEANSSGTSARAAMEAVMSTGRRRRIAPSRTTWSSGMPVAASWLK